MMLAKLGSADFFLLLSAAVIYVGIAIAVFIGWRGSR